jgi:uncharacterized membrane protein
MDLQPLLSAPAPVILHFATVAPAFVLGTWLLFASEKGSPRHRLVGKIYLCLMSATAIAAVFIRSFSNLALEIGGFRFGLLHLFVLLTAWSVWTALRSARAGNIGAHQGAMRGLYFGGLIFAGLLAFLPGRIMHRMFFG